jgi:tetratricopeptide (TPR) repeat protein
LFLTHPIHVEVVANSSHRKDSLALSFLLMALIAYMKMFDHKFIKQRIIWLILSILLWITAFFAKGNSLVFPIIIMAYEYALVPEERRLIIRWNKIVPVLLSLSGVGLIIWYWYISSLPSFKMTIIGAFAKTDNMISFSFTAYLLMVLKSITFMFSKLLLPLDLSMEYIYPVPDSFIDPWVIFAFVIISGVAALAFKWAKKSPTQLFLLAFSIILWLPTGNILWHFSYFAADRYMYAPSAGLSILVMLIFEKVADRDYRKHYVIFSILLISTCAVLTWKQTKVWHNDKNLYSQMLKVSPRSLEAMVGLSGVFYDEEKYDTSTMYARKAMERDFTDFRPYLLLGNINFKNGHFNEALELFLESQRRNPLSPEVHNAIGSTYDELGKTDQAIESFKTALRLRPEYFQVNTNLGVTYERINKYTDAEIALKKALDVNHDHVPAWYNLGVVRYKINDKQGARSAFYEVVKRDPTHQDALTNLSIVCNESGDVACYKDAERRISAVGTGNQQKRK